MVLQQLGQLGQKVIQANTDGLKPQLEQGDYIQRHLCEYPEGSQADAPRVEELPLLRVLRLPGHLMHGPVRSHDPHGLDERTDAPIPAGPVRAGARHPGQALLGGGPHVAQGEAALVELLVELEQAHPALNPHMPAVLVHPDELPVVVQGDEMGALTQSDGGEAVPSTHHFHSGALLRGLLDHTDHLLLTSWREILGRPADLPPVPVRPAQPRKATVELHAPDCGG
mmetsp:Transcript_17163/g.41299  ORF Transcript_17163/g.41299 Transcript_17163/m.41299 type:complete len:226 (+) Transcript_17163:726-1403(+)